MCLKIAIKCLVWLIPLNLGLENQDISEAIIRTTAPPLCSSKGGTAHGEQERNSKLVIHGQKRKEPNGHSSGKWRKVTTTNTCLLQKATVWCDQMELPTVKPAKLKWTRGPLLYSAMKRNTKYLCCQRQICMGKELLQILTLLQNFQSKLVCLFLCFWARLYYIKF